MANESELRDRWGKIFKGTAEYQNALKQSAIRKAAREQQLKAAMRDAPNAGYAARLQSQLMELRHTPDATVAGLDAYQEQRTRDFIDETRAAGAEAAMTAPASVANGPKFRLSQLDPDFKYSMPYADWNPRAQFGISNKDIAQNQVTALDQEVGDQWSSPQDRFVAANKSAYLSGSYGAKSSDVATRNLREDRALKSAFLEKQKREQMDEERKFLRSKADAAAKKAAFDSNDIMLQERVRKEDKDGSLSYFYNQLDDANKTMMQKLPWEKQIEWLKTHPQYTGKRAISARPEGAVRLVNGVLTRAASPMGEGAYTEQELDAQGANDFEDSYSLPRWRKADVESEQPDDGSLLSAGPTELSKKERIRRIFEEKDKSRGPLFPNAVWKKPFPTSWDGR